MLLFLYIVLFIFEIFLLMIKKFCVFIEFILYKNDGLNLLFVFVVLLFIIYMFLFLLKMMCCICELYLLILYIFLLYE